MTCVFCPDNWDNLDIIEQESFAQCDVAILNPLKPVTEGHVLVIGSLHTDNASELPWTVSSTLMAVAGTWVAEKGIQANIITSIGPLATQTVMHTHLHVVPRRENDDLPLPWTPQHMEQERWRRMQADLDAGRFRADH